MTPAEKRLQRAKRAAEALTTDHSRPWLVAEVRSYGGESYLTRLHVMQGTPPRAYILENAEREVCTLLDMEGRVVGEARYGGHEPVTWVPLGKRHR